MRKPQDKDQATEENEEIFFDDCAVCHGMKKAIERDRDLSLEELTKLFEKQNQQS